MTARRSAAGRSRTTAPSVQGALEDRGQGDLRRAGSRPRRRPHRRRRACAGAGRALRYRQTFRAGPVSRRPERASAAASDRRAQSRRSCRIHFEARFSAKKRHYLYRIVNRRANLALDIGHVWRLPRPLDTDAMHEAAQRLVGKHDFTTFRDTECQAKSPEKTLDQLDVVQGWRRRQHRDLGALVPAQPGALDGRLAGLGRRGPLERRRSCRRAAARNRAACGPVAPPDGLYLVRVDY